MKVALFGTQTEVIHIFISVNKLAGMSIDPKQLARPAAIAEPDYQYG